MPNPNKQSTDEISKEELVFQLKKRAIMNNFGRLLQILINLFSTKKYLKKLEKWAGKEIQLNFPGIPIEENTLTFVISDSPTDPFLRSSENAIATITFNVEEEEIIPSTVERITSSKTAVLFFGISGIK